jgi:hypothetical protein
MPGAEDVRRHDVGRRTGEVVCERTGVHDRLAAFGRGQHGSLVSQVLARLEVEPTGGPTVRLQAGDK